MVGRRAIGRSAWVIGSQAGPASRAGGKSVVLLNTHSPCSNLPRWAKIGALRRICQNFAIKTRPISMNSSNFAKPIVYALYVNAAILLAILLTLIGRVCTGAEPAYGQ